MNELLIIFASKTDICVTCDVLIQLKLVIIRAFFQYTILAFYPNIFSFGS